MLSFFSSMSTISNTTQNWERVARLGAPGEGLRRTVPRSPTTRG
jgi:hypothetical protein